MFAAGVTVTVVRSPGFDAYGDRLSGDPERITLAGVALAPRTGGPATSSADIENRGREGVREGLTLYAQVGVDIRRTDQIEVDELSELAGLYDVDGEPGPWVSPFDGWEAGVEVSLNRAEG
jgi:hypothetical protein